MKRGLVKFDSEETPHSCYEARIADFQQALEERGCAAGLVYGDVSRSSDIAYLTNFCLYWNEAVLGIPAQGNVQLIMKLSKRVNAWIERTTVIEDIASGPKVAQNIGKFLDSRVGSRDARIGIIDLAWWPAALLQQVREELPTVELVDIPGLVRKERLAPSTEELALLRSATRAMASSLETAWATATLPDDRVSVSVRESRMAGFVDADVTSESLSDGSQYIAAKGQYRYSWIQLCQARGGAMAEASNAALDHAIANLKAGVSESELVESASQKIDGRYEMAFSCLSHTDLESGGAFRPADEDARAIGDGEVVATFITLFNDDDICMASRMVLVKEDGAEVIA